MAFLKYASAHLTPFCLKHWLEIKSYKRISINDFVYKNKGVFFLFTKQFYYMNKRFNIEHMLNSTPASHTHIFVIAYLKYTSLYKSTHTFIRIIQHTKTYKHTRTHFHISSIYIHIITDLSPYGMLFVLTHQDILKYLIVYNFAAWNNMKNRGRDK